MNGKKAKMLRREAGFDPKAERIYVRMQRKYRKRRHGSNGFDVFVRGTLESAGPRKRYQNLKKAYRQSVRNGN